MAHRTWKQRFAGRKQKQGAQGGGLEGENDELKKPTSEKAQGSLRRSSRFTIKKNMKKRFSQVLSKATNKKEDEEEQESESSPSNPQSPLTLDAPISTAARSPPTAQSKPNLDPQNNHIVTPGTKSELYEWQDSMERKEKEKMLRRKQRIKERDGFCRRVDSYDGQVIVVDGKPAYELGNYLGGGVAGVVYEGNTLLPRDEYPVRIGAVVDEPQIIEQPSRPPSTFSCLDPSMVAPSSVTASYKQDSVRDTSFASTQASSKTETTGSMMTTAVMEIETTQESILVDRVDAPSRSQAQASAAASGWFMEEIVAIKILNPVGFRLLSPQLCQTAVVVKEGEVWKGDTANNLPMEERHVWWIVNPNSRNLATLQRYNQKHKDGILKKSRDVDRGTKEKGLRLSLVAAYMEKGKLRELPLTRCIEIWGHVPFGASEIQFEEMMEAIERINAGHAPLQHLPERHEIPLSPSDASIPLLEPLNMETARTGLYRAAATSRRTVFCENLNAYIALPAVPPKYLRWLRQRRSATKEIRNMMLIGRHKNVVHLYEVLELIQESKSTMFLVLELVRGGELFDLISSNSGSKKGVDADSEMMMRKFFRELCSGIHYCHTNGIAHRDLKPENLLVHNGLHGDESTLKIADFGLSATFATGNQDDETIRDSVMSPIATPYRGSRDATSIQSMHQSTVVDTDPELVERDSSISSSISALGVQALQYLTCGTMDDVSWCAAETQPEDEQQPSPLRRMTSVVGSPHYVAPEIISQSEDLKMKRSAPGYDGTKADVWSAGVILYAMLYRSLPFGEDLLRCPRYQSFRKWYDEARTIGGRRSTAMAALNPVITEADEADMLGPHWFFPSDTSKESRDLIVAMLNPDPVERLSIHLVLQHPWFRMKDLLLS